MNKDHKLLIIARIFTEAIIEVASKIEETYASH